MSLRTPVFASDVSNTSASIVALTRTGELSSFGPASAGSFLIVRRYRLFLVLLVLDADFHAIRFASLLAAAAS